MSDPLAPSVPFGGHQELFIMCTSLGAIFAFGDGHMLKFVLQLTKQTLDLARI